MGFWSDIDILIQYGSVWLIRTDAAPTTTVDTDNLILWVD